MARYPNGVNYKFKKPQRPEADQAVFALLKLIKGYSVKELDRECAISKTTIYNIRNRATRYPQNYTVDQLVQATGHTRGILTKDEWEMIENLRKGSSHAIAKAIKSSKRRSHGSTGNRNSSRSVGASA